MKSIKNLICPKVFIKWMKRIRINAFSDESHWPTLADWNAWIKVTTSKICAGFFMPYWVLSQHFGGISGQTEFDAEIYRSLFHDLKCKKGNERFCRGKENANLTNSRHQRHHFFRPIFSQMIYYSQHFAVCIFFANQIFLWLSLTNHFLHFFQATFFGNALNYVAIAFPQGILNWTIKWIFWEWETFELVGQEKKETLRYAVG